MLFGQLRRDDAQGVQKILEMRRWSRNAAKELMVLIAGAPYQLKKVTLPVNGNEYQALLDSRALSNLLSLRLVERMGIITKITPKKIAVNNEAPSESRGIVKLVSISMDSQSVSFDLLVTTNPSFHVIIVLPALESFKDCVNCGTNVISLKNDTDAAKIPLKLDTGRGMQPMAEVDSENFTSTIELKGSSPDSEYIDYFRDIMSDGK